MKITALDYEPTCGAMIRLDDEGGAGSLILVCTLDQEHRGPDHEDDEGNRWHLVYGRIPNGVEESVAFTWGGRTALPGGVGWRS